MVTLTIQGQLPNLNDYTKACRTNKMAEPFQMKNSFHFLRKYWNGVRKKVNYHETCIA